MNKIWIADAFANAPFTGNPAAVIIGMLQLEVIKDRVLIKGEVVTMMQGQWLV